MTPVRRWPFAQYQLRFFFFSSLWMGNKQEQSGAEQSGADYQKRSINERSPGAHVANTRAQARTPHPATKKWIIIIT